MSEVDGPDDITNGDDSAFDNEDDQQTHQTHVTQIAELQVANPENKHTGINNQVSQFDHGVFVTNPHSLITAGNTCGDDDDDRLKSTHVVFHNSKLEEIANIEFPTVGTGESGLRTPTTPLPPPTPATPLSRERGLRYQWDASAFNEVVPVRCKNASGDLHKSKFGSGVTNFRTFHLGS